ncbi:MAG: serine/threonine-protein kinase, partial [Acidobacteria bacterium]|nr:serine/threonine-protein kinase [Acidobacteriota bacterium]
MIGRTLSHYKILDQLGEGGMGKVYLAEDTALQREVALKVLLEEVASDPHRLKRFIREAKTVAKLNHPNIVTIYSVEKARLEEEEEPVHFLTMELVEGETLSALIPSEGFPLAKFFELAIPLADAVSSAHERGITHRDLKPANVMV